MSNLLNFDSSFTEDTEPEDTYLTKLLKLAYRGDIYCMQALADLNVIKPFSIFEPVVSKQYRKYFQEELSKGTPPSLYVYPKKDYLIMSDDYNAFAMYKDLNLGRAHCIVIGNWPQIEGVAYSGESFVLPTPSIEVLPDSED